MHSLNSSLSAISAETLIDIDSQNQYINLFSICNANQQALSDQKNNHDQLNAMSCLTPWSNNHAILSTFHFNLKLSTIKHN